jgi:hypothetical protein
MIEKLLTVYWSQTTLFIVAIAYFIKRVFDNKSKKMEINHSLFQENRLKVISNFYTHYAKTTFLWHHLAIYDVLSNKLSAKEIDDLIWPILDDLKKSQMELQIYFDDQEMVLFKDLVDGVYSINKKLSDLFFNSNSNNTLSSKVNEFHIFQYTVDKKNEQIIKQISDIIKATYEFNKKKSIL